jgi:uncharacterized protein
MSRVVLHGILGRALDANAAGRLSHFITDPTSPAIALFAAAHRDANREGDWYGEHAGKWLVAAARAAVRTGDAKLAGNVRRVADFLVAQQLPGGYLGTYAPERRFMVKQPPPPRSWNGEPSLRTWDIWIHSYLILGLVEVHRQFPDAKYLDAARAIAELCLRTFEGGIDVTHLGNHFGMSATVLLDAAMELYFTSGDPHDLALAQRVLAQAEERPELALVSRALAGADASEIATGKAYQLCWNLVGVAKLHRATGEAHLLRAVLALWENIREHHLTLGGGPWGGVAHRSREVFNARGAFSPHGYVETCSTFAWIQLNRELLRITGEARFAEEIERSAYNDLLGAQAPDGEDWLYYSFPNGKRVFTTYWRCCKSSGAMALEELPPAAIEPIAGGVRINLLGPASAEFEVAGVGSVGVEMKTTYPFEGHIRLRVRCTRPSRFALHVRIPSWAEGATLDGKHVEAGTFATLEREWKDADEATLVLPMAPRSHRATLRNVQESVAPDGSPVAQEVLRHEFIAFARGPLVYATGLVDGYRTGETLRLPVTLEEGGALPEAEGPALRVLSPGREPITFFPWFEAVGRRDGTWRLTWLSVAPEETP